MVVAAHTDPVLRLEPSEKVFSGQFFRDASPVPQYDVTADGQRFLMMRSGGHRTMRARIGRGSC